MSPDGHLFIDIVFDDFDVFARFIPGQNPEAGSFWRWHDQFAAFIFLGFFSVHIQV